jgi:hypothetical protein
VPAGHFVDVRLRELRGNMSQGLATSSWCYLDERGHELARREFAVLPDPLSASPVFGAPRSAAAWQDLARELRAQHRCAEAILAAARALAAGGDLAGLDAELATRAPTLAEASAQALSAAAVEKADGDLRVLADALQRGGEPASLLRHIGAGLVPVSVAARDLLDAALRLAPLRRDYYVPRALVNLAIGDPDGALADAQQLDPSDEVLEFLLGYRRVVFPSFDFWPRRAEIASALTGIPDAPQQPLAEIRLTIQKFATRLSRVREALLTHSGGVGRHWMPPQLAHLLPNGPVALARRVIRVTEEDGSELEVPIDEELDLTRHDVTSLMRIARSEWNGLTWCCYAAGLDTVALPDRLEPPADFAQAVGMAAERCWRTYDRLTTSGLRALSRGIPGFTWEGLEIDTMPRLFAEIAAHEYRELRALLFFLCDEEAESAWQADLREE